MMVGRWLEDNFPIGKVICKTSREYPKDCNQSAALRRALVCVFFVVF